MARSRKSLALALWSFSVEGVTGKFATAGRLARGEISENTDFAFHIQKTERCVI
jgi:hypothetical protein